MAFPDAAVAFVGHSKNVWRELPQMVLGVLVHPPEVIKTWDLLVWVDSCQDAANVGLETEKKRHFMLFGVIKIATHGTNQLDKTCRENMLSVKI